MAQNENAVMYAVEQVCSLYDVQVTREQSRQFNVQGAAGRWRPMFFGTWTDALGRKRNKGKADFLARPRVRMFPMGNGVTQIIPYTPFPLWIECKSLKGKQTPDQAAFQQWVEANGDGYLLLREDARPLHKGPMFCCPLELAGCSSKLIGKVWSPDLRRGARAKAAPRPEVEI